MSVTALEIDKRVPFAGGMPFGNTGSYEQLDGTARFAVDPDHPGNELITDLKLTPGTAPEESLFQPAFAYSSLSTPKREPPVAAGCIEPGEAADSKVCEQRTRQPRPQRGFRPGQRFPDEPRLHPGLVRLAARRSGYSRVASHPSSRRRHRDRPDLGQGDGHLPAQLSHSGGAIGRPWPPSLSRRRPAGP